MNTQTEIGGGRPVFIIGGSRTGSTMLKTILTTSREIDLVDEMHFFSVPWLRASVADTIRKRVGPLDTDGALEKVVDVLYSTPSDSWFWREAERLLNRDMLVRELSSRPLTIQNIFHAILIVHAEMRSRPRLGAKFPTHYSFTDTLLAWYPDALLLHTTRNPKAVYASQGRKYIESGQGLLARGYMRFRQFVHINIQITWTARLHRQLRSMPNYRLVRYEDLVTDPETQIREICEFLDISFLPDMLSPKRYGSSYEKPGVIGEGVETSSLERWRSSIHPLTAKAINILHPRAFGILGFDRD